MKPIIELTEREKIIISYIFNIGISRIRELFYNFKMPFGFNEYITIKKKLGIYGNREYYNYEASIINRKGENENIFYKKLGKEIRKAGKKEEE